MLHRPTLMPASMRSANKTCNASRPTDQLNDLDYASPVLSSFLEDEEIVVVEPTDPDEDRLREEARLQAEINSPLQPTTSTWEPSDTVSESSAVPESSEPPSSNQARITICTESGKPINVIPLNETIQSILACTNQTTIPNVSVQPLVSAKLAPTSYIIQSPLGAILLSSPVQNTSTSTKTIETTQPNTTVNPLVTAVLVNCSTIDVMNQLTGKLSNGQTPVTISETNIVIPQSMTGSLIPKLFSGIPLSTIATASVPSATPSFGSTLVPVTLAPKPVTPAADTPKPVFISKLRETRRYPTVGRVKPFKCPMPNCERAFYSQYSQRKHIRFHTGERPFRCPELNCLFAFKEKSDLRDHWRKHLTNKQISYKTFEMEFEKALKQASERPKEPPKLDHIKPAIQPAPPVKIVPNIKPAPKPHKPIRPAPVEECRRFYCTFRGCDKSYTRRHRLNQHIATHTGTGPIQCDEPNCHVRYFSAEDLRRHKMSHLYAADRNLRRKHACTYPNCGKAYSKLNKLKEHIRSHTGERPFVCRVPGCGASFIQLYGVKRHEMTHMYSRKRVHRLTRFPTTVAKVLGEAASENMDTGTNSSATTVTQADTNSTATCSNAILLAHKPPEPVEITQVNAVPSSEPTTTSASRMLPAIAPRTNEIKMRSISPIHGAPGMRRPHVCPFKECGRAFPKLNKLREHVCRHTGERPFACDRCSASFVRVYDLRRHTNVHLRALESRIQSRPLAPRTSCVTTSCSSSVTTTTVSSTTTTMTTTNTATSSEATSTNTPSDCPSTIIIKAEPN